MPHPLPGSAAGLVATVAVAGWLYSVPADRRDGQPIAQPTRTIYVSATDKSGAAVSDLQAGDFEIKDGGKACAIVSVAPAEIPLRIAVLVADQGTGAFQL